VLHRLKIRGVGHARPVRIDFVRHADQDRIAEHFTLGNPDGPGQDDLPALLRRVAEAIEQLGAVELQDLVLHPETNEFGDCHSMTVYFVRRTTLHSVK
jgi:hypothetical protein